MTAFKVFGCRPAWAASTTQDTITRSVAECEYRFYEVSRGTATAMGATRTFSNMNGMLCEDHETVMVYLTFGAPGDDPREVDV